MAYHKRVAKTFCTTREAADILGVSLRTAQLWTESGLLTAWKTDGGHRRISRDSIERLLANSASHARPSSQKKGKARRVAQSASGCRFSILVVESQEEMRREYARELSRWPTKPAVTTVADGYEALIRLGLEKPDMVIADLLMPGMSGAQMIRSMRAVPELLNTVIVAVSSVDLRDIDRDEVIPAGIPILPKPVPFDQLRVIAEQRAVSSAPTFASYKVVSAE